MSIDRISEDDFRRAELSRREPTALPGSAVLEVPLAQLTVSPRRARAWRVTFGRLERVDGQSAIAVGGPRPASLLFPSQVFSFYAGRAIDTVLPIRSNPVFQGGGAYLGEPWAMVTWGTGSAKANRLLAHWPAVGGSIVVVGSSVEVSGGINVPPEVDPPAEWPVFKAEIAPAEGQLTEDCELSIAQYIEVPAPGYGNAYVPDFARRVRVVSADRPGNPSTCQFIDDQGALLDTWDTVQEPGFHEIPGAATILRIYNDSPLSVLAHWRIAP